MGDMKEMISMIPGMGKQLKNLEIDENQFTVVESIIHSMTPAERNNPSPSSTAAAKGLPPAAAAKSTRRQPSTQTI